MGTKKQFVKIFPFTIDCKIWLIDLYIHDMFCEMYGKQKSVGLNILYLIWKDKRKWQWNCNEKNIFKNKSKTETTENYQYGSNQKSTVKYTRVNSV